MPPDPRRAVVTLITSNAGYPAGALAIAAALEVHQSTLRRIVLVTPNVDTGIRELLRTASWEVRLVDPIVCQHKLGPAITPDKYDVGAEYQAKKAKWALTCCKFHAWSLTFLDKLLFIDADVLLLRPIDMLIQHPSAFAAAPDTFPADQFNSGVMVISPSRTLFEELQAWNQEHGSAEGGDQCLLNEFFSDWFFNAWDDPVAGRLPWIMNIPAAHYGAYRTLARMQSREEPTVLHFVGGEGKPWLFTIRKMQGQQEPLPHAMAPVLHAFDQLYWAAKTGKLCDGGFDPPLLEALQQLLAPL